MKNKTVHIQNDDSTFLGYNPGMPVIELDPTRLPWPTQWKEVFGRPAPLIIEIGFGGADFLVELAKICPKANVLGVEISAPSIRKAVSKLNQAGVTNGRVLQANARLLLQALCPPHSIREIHINFPDPWPKERHHGRRLINDDFLILAATRLLPGGRLNIATDHADYAAWINQHLARTPYFQSRLALSSVTTDNQRLRTKYELIALNQGRTCHYFKWERNPVPAPDKFPVPKELPMPHVVIRTPLTLSEISRRFGPQTAVDSGIHIKFMEAYQSGQTDKLLVETYINEAPMRQRVALIVRRRQTGDLVIGLHELGFPRPTPGIQAAIAHLARWIIGLHPDTAVTANNLGQKLERERETAAEAKKES